MQNDCCVYVLFHYIFKGCCVRLFLFVPPLSLLHTWCLLSVCSLLDLACGRRLSLTWCSQVSLEASGQQTTADWHQGILPPSDILQIKKPDTPAVFPQACVLTRKTMKTPHNPGAPESNPRVFARLWIIEHAGVSSFSSSSSSSYSRRWENANGVLNWMKFDKNLQVNSTEMSCTCHITRADIHASGGISSTRCFNLRPPGSHPPTIALPCQQPPHMQICPH